jgi:murein DD-endopeptidase MepM/ murein hydrolase activator NlpD
LSLTPSSLLPQARTLAHRHRRGIFAGAAALLAGFGISAVAIAPLAPDAARLPQQLVSQAVEPHALDTQLESLALHDLALVRNDITRSTDSADSLLSRLGVTDSSAAAFLRSDLIARGLVTGRGGKMVQAQTTADGSLVELVARYPAVRSEVAGTHFTRLSIARIDGRWTALSATVPMQSRPRLAAGRIESSLFAATDAAGLPDAVAVQLADIFSADVDFHRELRRGDTFSVVYETLTADGEPVTWNEGVGRVLAAEFVNAGRVHHALWFAQPGARSGYYGLDGSSRRRVFLASPMEFSRITSGFAMRMHPILQTRRRHLGVDYAAPTGTPVRVVGDGTVEFSGWQNGYGNVVKVRHGNDRTTLYAHLSRIDVRRGQRVDQGQRVGAVGSTGWATGPHLHFEFLVRGVHQDPVRVAKASEVIPLEASARARFAEIAQGLQAKLATAVTVASARTARFE